MLRPIDAKVYLVYRCSKCGSEHDYVRLEAVNKNQQTTISCMICDNVDELERVGVSHTPKLLLGFADNRQSTAAKNTASVGQKHSLPEYNGHQRKVISNLKKYGYSSEEIHNVLGSMGDDWANLSYLEMMKKILVILGKD